MSQDSRQGLHWELLGGPCGQVSCVSGDNRRAGKEAPPLEQSTVGCGPSEVTPHQNGASQWCFRSPDLWPRCLHPATAGAQDLPPPLCGLPRCRVPCKTNTGLNRKCPQGHLANPACTQQLGRQQEGCGASRCPFASTGPGFTPPTVSMELKGDYTKAKGSLNSYTASTLQ